MKSSISALKKLGFTEKSVPPALFIICLFGFGLLMPTIGFYMDDWPYVFYAYNKGIGSLQEMLYYDSRPNAAWLFMIGFKMLGFRPIIWHLVNLTLRWATATLVWMIIKNVWQHRKIEAAYISLLFVIYPFFMMQSSAVGYTNHWFGFAALFLSILLMIRAMNKSKSQGMIFTILALVLEAAHMFTSEYFAGLEFIRIPILWILISRTDTSFFKKTVKVFLAWLPYSIVLIAYTYWRVVIFQNPPGINRNSPVIFLQLFSQPIQAIIHLITVLIKDTFAVLTLGWQQSLDTNLINFTSVYSLFRIAISIIIWFLGYYYLSNLQFSEDRVDDNWKSGSLLVAIVALVTAGLPVWLIGKSVFESKNLTSASRFGLPAMFGAAIFFILIINYFISEHKKKIVFLSLLLAFSINFHINNTKQFKVSWEKQILLANQLLWRAPYITPGTAILTDEEVLGVMGDYATSFFINTLYQPKDVKNSPPYWYFPFYYTYPSIDSLLRGIPMEGAKHSIKFTGTSKQMLLLSYNPELDHCLWILQSQDTNLRLVSEDMRKLSQGSDISLIQLVKGVQPTLPKGIFGEQSIHHGWCYYFQKADLARQFHQWDDIVQLWREADSMGERAGSGFEYIPFIEGFAHTGDWAQTRLLTKWAKDTTKGLEPSLCTALDRIKETAPTSLERDGTVNELKNALECVNYQ